MPKPTPVPVKPLDMHDERILRAIDMTFAGRFTEAKIAESCHIAARTYRYWRAHHDFQAALTAKRADFAASVEHVTFADKARRVHALNDAALIALADLEERPKLKEVRPTKDGAVTNESFNVGAMSEFRAALADIAAEKGERKTTGDATAIAAIRISIETDGAVSAVTAEAAAIAGRPAAITVSTDDGDSSDSSDPNESGPA